MLSSRVAMVSPLTGFSYVCRGLERGHVDVHRRGDGSLCPYLGLDLDLDLDLVLYLYPCCVAYRDLGLATANGDARVTWGDATGRHSDPALDRGRDDNLSSICHHLGDGHR